MAAKTKPGSGLLVLVVDDEPGVRSVCRAYLERIGCTVEEAGDFKTAERALAGGRFGLALLDVRLPDGSGLDLFRTVRENQPDVPLAIITGHASVEAAVEAVKGGALDYITKPFDVARLKEVVDLAARRLPVSRRSARRPLEFHGILAASQAMRSICGLIERAAESVSTVLIQGESGSGKELAARAVHEAGPNAGQPFVPIDCSSIPPSLLESELFGHRKGAFTGAHADSDGLFLSAGTGTVFLDEIGELPRPLQPKLLRTLQEREVRPVGFTRPLPFAARVIVATNRDLRTAMADGHFRRDLFYRLHVIPICLPPLRTRREDIAPLAQRFLKDLNRRSGRRAKFSRGALRQLERRDWPGNVRELQNWVERAFALSTGDLIDEAALEAPGAEPQPPRKGDRIEDYERQAIQAALRKTNGNREKAAKILDIGVATLFRRLKKYKLK